MVTDLDLLERRVAAAASQPPEIATSILHQALDLVRGPIFGYPDAEGRPFAWVDLENWASIWEVKITSVAQHLAEMFLDLGRADDAVAVGNHALRVVPTHAGLTEMLMRAHAVNGDHTAIRSVYIAHEAALDDLDFDAPAESTRKVYEELRTGR